MSKKQPPHDHHRPHGQKGEPLSGSLSRRVWLASAAGAAVVGAVLPPKGKRLSAAEQENSQGSGGVVRGRINQSVVAWCFKPMSIEALAKASVSLGIKSVELVDPKHWPILKKYGLACAIARSHGFERGLNHLEHHAECLGKLEQSIEAAADFGTENVITFSGMQGKLNDEEGKKNTVIGLKKVIRLAEKKKINLCIEPLNTRVDIEMKGHPGYQCDTVEWAVDVCDRIGSPRVKILFDIYHQQIMQGDLIVRIKQFKDYIAHYHTAGVPGRKELDASQEINYPAVMRAILETGYQGYVGQEFIPTRDDKIAALRQAVQVCDV